MKSTSDQLFEEYEELANTKGIEKIPEPARTLIAVYTAQGIIGNGGLAYFFKTEFSGDNSYEVIIQSYRNIGLESYARSIERVLSLFPNGIPHESMEQRESFIYKYMSGDDEKNHSVIVDEAEDIFYSDIETVYKLADEHANTTV
jgi:Domain of unknown function (DUF4375)